MPIPAYEAVKALSIGEQPPNPFRMSWGVHQGMRGTDWTIIASDGVVSTNLIKPSRGPVTPSKPTPIGQLSPDELRAFAAILCAQRFDLIQIPPPTMPDLGGASVDFVVGLPDERFSLQCPSAQLEDVYGLAEIGRQFAAVRGRW